MRIVFAETPSPWLVKRNTQISLGMLYLATVLNEKGYETCLVHPETIEDFKHYGDADIVCFSGTTLEYPMTRKCALQVKDHFPSTKRFVGGPHATALWRNIVGSGIFDAIGVGEGEEIILDMVRDVEHGTLQKVYVADKCIGNLDTIPSPNRSLIKGEYGDGLFAYGEHYLSDKSESIMTSRGCSNNCAFCASKLMWKRKVRYRSVGSVVTEIQYLIDSMGIKQFGIWDDIFTTHRRRCLSLCKRIQSLGIAWKCSARASTLDPTICEAMVNAGCKEVAVGLESGDQRVLDFINKRATTEAMAQGCANASKAGLKVRGMFITGLPGERKDTPELTIDYIQKLDVDIVRLFIFTPLPGSPVWNNPSKYNCEILTKDFTKYNEYSFIMENGDIVHNEYEPLIHNRFLTIHQMKDNFERMRVYVEEMGKYSKG